MATIHKTIPFINGAYIDINNETNKNPKLYTGTNSALEQAEYSFESDGQVWVRTRTRANATDNWGAWSSWVHANTTETETRTAEIQIDSSNIDVTTTPSSTVYGKGIVFRDTSGTNVDVLRPVSSSAGLGLYLQTSRTVSGSTKYNGLWLRLDSSGNPVVTLNGTGSQEAWLSALGLASATRTSTIANIISVNSTNATIVEASYAQYGKVAQVYIQWKNKKAITVPAHGNITNISIGAIVSGKRPYVVTGAQSQGDLAGAAWYNIQPNGNIELGAVEGTGASRTIAANSAFYLLATYILA